MPDLKNSDWINRIIRINGPLAQLKEMEKADNENKWQKLNKELNELFEDNSEDLCKANAYRPLARFHRLLEPIFRSLFVILIPFFHTSSMVSSFFLKRAGCFPGRIAIL
jgi:hypothetical protein